MAGSPGTPVNPATQVTQATMQPAGGMQQPMMQQPMMQQYAQPQGMQYQEPQITIVPRRSPSFGTMGGSAQEFMPGGRFGGAAQGRPLQEMLQMIQGRQAPQGNLGYESGPIDMGNGIVRQDMGMQMPQQGGVSLQPAGGMGSADPSAAYAIDRRYQNLGAMGGVAAGLAQSMRGAATEMGYQPGQISAPQVGSRGYDARGYGASQIAGVGPVTAQNVQAGQLSQTNLNPYMNPFTEQVIKANEQDILRGAQLGLNQLGAQAQAAGAFGGSRQAITEAELGRNVLQQLAQSSAGLRSQGFQQAQSAAQQDIAGRMQAALANQGAGLQAGTTTAQLGLQGQLANQAAMNQAAQFGAGAYNQAAQFGAGAFNQAQMQNAANMLAAQQANQQAGLAGSAQRLSAAGQLGNLSNLGFGALRSVNQDLFQQGMMQQGLQQALIDAARGQYAGFTGAPQTALNTQLGAYAGSQTGEQTQTTSRQPGLFDYLSLGASFA